MYRSPSGYQRSFLGCAILICAFALRVSAQAPPTPAGPSYRDPQGRFTLQLPSGWTATQLNSDAVQFSGGLGYVSVLTLPSADPELMINSIATATGKQWQNFSESRRGPVTLAGRPGKYVTYSGINPAGKDAFLEMVGVSDGSLTYLFMTSAPTLSFITLRFAFDQLEQSFALSSTAAKSLPPPPAAATQNGGVPAGARANPAPPPSAAAPRQPAPTSAATQAEAGNVYRMKFVKIIDTQGFERPLTAMTLLVPTDWQFQGTVQYTQVAGCYPNVAKIVFRAASPDGRLAIELLPGNTWQWTDDANMRNMLQTTNQQAARFGRRGCDMMPVMTADDFLRRNVIPAARRTARVAASESMPEAAQRVQEEARQVEQMGASQGVRATVRADASRVRIAYSDAGQPVEEWVTAMTSSIGMPGPTFDMRTGRMGQAMVYTNTADHLFAMRAPQGQLDAQEKFFQLIMSTVRVDPEWQGRVQQVISNLQAQEAQGARDRAVIISKSGQDTSRIIHDTYQNTNNTRDHAMASWSQYMRGVQTFRNPSTGETVELSNQYTHGWAGSDGTYVVTDSSTYNPNSSLQGTWTQLDPVKQ